MQGLRRDSGSADILTYFGEWHKSEFPGYQPGNVLLEKAVSHSKKSTTFWCLRSTLMLKFRLLWEQMETLLKGYLIN